MRALKLLIASGLILVLELVLSRFLSTEVPAFGFFTNLILIAAFLGLGVGLNRQIRLPTAPIPAGPALSVQRRGRDSPRTVRRVQLIMM